MPATATTVKPARAPFVGNWGHLGTEEAFITFLRGRANVAPVTPSTSMPNFARGQSDG